MKKNFVKKLALGLAMVMAVSSVNVPASAATKPAFKTASVSVEAGETVKAVIKGTKNWTVKKVVSKDEAVATIAKVAQKTKKTNVKVTGVKAGETTVVATLTKGDSKVKAKLAVEVTSAQEIVEFKAVTPKKLTVKFAEALTNTIAKDSVTLVAADGAKVLIQDVTVSTDKQFVTIDLYSDLTSGTAYTVSVVADETYTADLAYVKGNVAKIVAANQIVEAGVAEPIVYTVYDENGLDITESTIVTFESNVSVASDGTVTLSDGVLAYVTVVYTDFTTGAQIKSETFTVTGTAAVASSITSVTIDDTTFTAWPKKVVTSIFKGDTTNNVIYTLYVDQYGNPTVAANGSTVAYESLDPSVFVVDNATGAITTVATGSAQLKVTVGKVTQYFTITVLAPSKATSLVLDTTYSVLKASMTNPTENVASVMLRVKDQYGNKLTAGTATGLTFTLVAGNGVVSDAAGNTLVVDSTVSATANTATTFTAVTPGTAVFKVTSADSTLNYTMVSITVYATDNTVVKYALKGVYDLDREHNYDDDATTNLYATNIALKPVNKDGFVVSEADNSVLTEALSGAAIVVITPDGTKVPNGTSFTVDTINDTNYQTTGTYNVVATVDGTTVATASFAVNDTGIAPKVTTKKVTVANGTAVTNNFTVATGWTITGVAFDSGNSSAIASATVASPATVLTNSSTNNVTLYNVKVIVTNATGRTFVIAIGSPIVVLPY